MINTKIRFAALIFLLPMSLLLKSCTKNTEPNISVDTVTSKTKAQLVSSTDPKIPLYAVDIKICKDENYIIPVDYFGDEEQVQLLENKCIKTSVPIWGSSDVDIVPKSFNPNIYFFKSSIGSRYLTTDRYEVVSSFYGCYSDSIIPQETESYYLLPKISINIEKKLTNSKKLIEIPDEMISISRIDDNNEVQKLLEQYHVNKEISYYNDCKLVDYSELGLN